MSQGQYIDLGRALMEDPITTHQMLRNESPVFRSNELGVVLVTRHEDVSRVLLDSGTFSSEYFATRTSSRAHQPAVAEILATGWPPSNALSHVDGPEHEFHAGLAKAFVSPRRVRELEGTVKAIVYEFVDLIPDRPMIDLIKDFAEDVAISVMCEFVGVSREDRHIWARGADAELALLGSANSEELAIAFATDYVRMQNRIAELLEDRQVSPTDDLLSAVATAAPPPGFELTMGQRIRIVQNVVVAGNETTRGLIASAVLKLCQDQTLQKRMRREPGAVETLLEETLRAEPPALMIYRVVERQTKLGGLELEVGEMVAVVLGSANYDEDVFECPHAFNIDRANAKRHITFGLGAHYCLGAPLARLEASIALKELLARFDEISLQPGAVLTYFPAFMIRNLTSLPLVLHRAAAEHS
jgi:cytochrome P450